jgi:hypothetical protein
MTALPMPSECAVSRTGRAVAAFGRLGRRGRDLAGKNLVALITPIEHWSWLK